MYSWHSGSPFSMLALLLTGCLFIGIHAGCVWEDRRVRIFPETVPDSALVFAVIGDYGEEGAPARQVSELVRSWEPTFILTTGDNNYWSGERVTLNENIGQYYCDFIYNPDAPDSLKCDGLAATEKQNRFFPSLGNHDFYSAEDHRPYLDYFTLPEPEEYYELRWGAVHCFALNSGEFGDAACCESEQARWLKAALEASDARLKLVFFHHAPFSAGRHGSNTYMQWPYAEWGADVVLSGHNHIYQRVIPKSADEIPYFVNGLGGRKSRYSCADNPLDPALFEQVCFDEEYGAMRISVSEQDVTFEFFSIARPLKPIDEYVIAF